MRILYRVLVRVRYYGREIPVGCDEIALLDLPSLRILLTGQSAEPSSRRIFISAKTNLVVAWPYESIIPKVTADVSRNDFSIDAIFGNEVLVRTGRGRLCASIPLSLSISSRHDEEIRGKLLQEERKGVQKRRRCRSRTPRQPRGWGGNTRS